MSIFIVQTMPSTGLQQWRAQRFFAHSKIVQVSCKICVVKLNSEKSDLVLEAMINFIGKKNATNLVCQTFCAISLKCLKRYKIQSLLQCEFSNKIIVPENKVRPGSLLHLENALGILVVSKQMLSRLNH